MPVQIGGAKAWKVRQHGDIGVAFQWVNEEPAMILFPARRSLPGAGAFVICHSASFKYGQSNTDKSPGYASKFLVENAWKIAQAIGFSPTDTQAANKIIDAIVDGLDDLNSMPPEPQQFNQEQAQAIGEMVIKVDGETIHEAEVTAPTEAELGVA